MSGPSIEREAFVTSRQLDFVSESELTKQCGYPVKDWPLVIVKELVDNALDACEEQGIVPEITITVDRDSITVADNGRGISPGIVDKVLDFSVRVSSREACVAPDRGAQGNALKTIVAMPFVLDGERGRVDICGQGTLSQVELRVDRIAQQPKAEVHRSGRTGSFVQVWWIARTSPEAAARTHLLREAAGRLYRLAFSFACLNPHLTLALDVLGNRHEWAATDPDWRKWRPSSPTCPHWYDAEHLGRLAGAMSVVFFAAGVGTDRAYCPGMLGCLRVSTLSVRRSTDEDPQGRVLGRASPVLGAGDRPARLWSATGRGRRGRPRRLPAQRQRPGRRQPRSRDREAHQRRRLGGRNGRRARATSRTRPSRPGTSSSATTRRSTRARALRSSAPWLRPVRTSCCDSLGIKAEARIRNIPAETSCAHLVVDPPCGVWESRAKWPPPPLTRSCRSTHDGMSPSTKTASPNCASARLLGCHQTG